MKKSNLSDSQAKDIGGYTSTRAMTSLDAFQPRPGQRVVALSAECAARAASDTLDLAQCWPELNRELRFAYEHPELSCWLVLPEVMDDSTALAVCRASHEIWVSEDELAGSATVRTLLRFRTESAPPSLGERKSVLHAPEVGCIRLWRDEGRNCVESRSFVSQGLPATDLTSRLNEIATLVAGNESARPDDWSCMASTLRSHADRLRYRVRASLAVLFALTSLGVVVLQWLAMSSLNIPMADLYSLFFLWVGGIYLWGRKLQWNSVQLAWHALADALDTQALLSRAGLRDGVITALYQLRHRRQIEWVREALRPMTWAAHRFQPSSYQSAQQLLTQWIPNAKRKHADWADRQATKAKWLDHGMKSCYAAGGLLTALVVTSGAVLPPMVNLFISATIGLMSSMGTLLLIFNSSLGFSQDAALQRHLEFVFTHAQRCLLNEMSPHEYEELLIDLGQECVQLAAERTLL